MTKNIIDQLKEIYFLGNIVVQLIYTNLVIFFSLLVIDFLIKINGLSFYTTVDLFALTSLNQLLTKPWQIISYSWLHGSLPHLLTNMITLYFIGQMFLERFQNKDLITFYIFGGITGGIFFLLCQSLFNYSHLLVGASAAIYSLFFALISYNSNIKIRLILIPKLIPLRYVACIFISIDVYNIMVNKNTGGSISHIGGAIFGYLYMKQFEKGNDFLGNLIAKARATIKNIFFIYKPKIYKNKSPYFSGNDVSKNNYVCNNKKNEKEKRVDNILDKISRSGYDSLSKEEKKILFKQRK